MDKQPNRSVLLVFRQAPYGKNLARDALDVALASAAFVTDLAVLFMGDGVYQLMPDQDPADTGLKKHAATLEALPVYGVERIYVDETSLQTRGLDPSASVIDLERVQAGELGPLIDQFDTVLSF